MYIENIVIGKTIAEPKSLLALNDKDWFGNELDKTWFTKETFLPRILVSIGIFPSVNEIRRNKPELVVNLDEIGFIELKVTRKRKVWIMIGEV